MISDIGTTDGTALLCNTNHRPTGSAMNSGGNWFVPDGNAVIVSSSVGSEDFGKNRGPGLVRLIRNSHASDPTPTEGIYSCIVQDDTLTEQTVYVGLYNSGGGGWLVLKCAIIQLHDCTLVYLIFDIYLYMYDMCMYMYICICMYIAALLLNIFLFFFRRHHHIRWYHTSCGL